MVGGKLVWAGGSAALLGCILIALRLTTPKVLMEDDGLEAASIEMDHDAMLASNPRKNAVFLKFFGQYAPTKLQQPEGATQLAETTGQPAKDASRSHTALKRLNSKLAEEMQARLTLAESKIKPIQTPKVDHGVRTLSHTKKVVNKGPSAATLDALDMVGSGHSHILPRKLRAKFVMDHGKKVLKQYPSSQFKDSSEPHSRSSNDISLAGKADDALLSAEMKPRNTAELVKQAALKQMQELKSTSTAPVTQLAQKPGIIYGAANNLPAAAYPAQGQLYEYPQNAYRPFYPSAYATAPQSSYAQPALYQPALYQAVPPQPYYPQQPMQTSYYHAPESMVEPQALQQSQPVYANSMLQQHPPFTPISSSARVNWRAQDLLRQAKGARMTPAQRHGMRSQMLALRSQILSDYRKNTAQASKALLMGPS